MKHIKFIEEIDAAFSSSAYVGYIPFIATEGDLFTVLSENLHFPDYFGENWDALDELYRDFSWIENDEIVIIHKELSQFHSSKLKIYIGIVLNCLDFWHHYLNDPHEVLFVFPKSEEGRITSIINECMQSDFFQFDLSMDDL